MHDLDGPRCTTVGWLSALSRRFTCRDYTGRRTRRNHHQAANRDLCAVAQHDVCDLRIDVHAINLSSDEQPLEEAHGFLSAGGRRKNRTLSMRHGPIPMAGILAEVYCDQGKQITRRWPAFSARLGREHRLIDFPGVKK